MVWRQISGEISGALGGVPGGFHFSWLPNQIYNCGVLWASNDLFASSAGTGTSLGTHCMLLDWISAIIAGPGPP